MRVIIRCQNAVTETRPDGPCAVVETTGRRTAHVDGSDCVTEQRRRADRQRHGLAARRVTDARVRRRCEPADYIYCIITITTAV